MTTIPNRERAQPSLFNQVHKFYSRKNVTLKLPVNKKDFTLLKKGLLL